MRQMSQAASNINWLINNFVERVPGVQEAVVVSSDGLPMAASTGLDRASADRFAAVASGLIGLAYGAAGRFGGGAVNEVIVEMENAFLFVTAAGQGTCLAVLAEADADVGHIAYEMAMLVKRVGQHMSTNPRQVTP